MADDGTESPWSEGFGFYVGEKELTYVYKKVTTNAELESGNYLIVYEDGPYAFNGGLTTLDVTLNYITVSINNSTIEWSSDIEASSFTYDASNGSLLSASGSYIGRTTNSNGFNTNSSPLTNTITIENGSAVIKSSAGPTLQFYSQANNSRFRYYSSTQKSLQLYKKVVE